MSEIHLPPLQSPSPQGDDRNFRSLYASKYAKKQSETEAQKIANRIAMLKQEQLKVTKKINETEQKALHIYKTKKEHFEKNEEKHKNQSHIQVAQTYGISSQQREKLKQIQLIQKEQKHQLVQTIKHINTQDIYDASNEKKQRIQHLQNRASNIRSQEQIINKNIQFKLMQKRMKVRSDVDLEIYNQLKEKQHYDLMIRSLEQEELDALKNLQNTQILQKSVVEKFKLAQTLTPNNFEEKFLGMELIKN